MIHNAFQALNFDISKIKQVLDIKIQGGKIGPGLAHDLIRPYS